MSASASGCAFSYSRLEQIRKEAYLSGVQDCASAKAAYCFLRNDRVEEAEILAGHFGPTRDRCMATTGPTWSFTTRPELSTRRRHRCNRDHPHCDRGQVPGRQAAAPHDVQHSDAFQFGSHHRRTSLGAFGIEVLDTFKVQGNKRAEEDDQSHAGDNREEREHPLDRWIGHLRQSTALAIIPRQSPGLSKM